MSDQKPADAAVPAADAAATTPQPGPDLPTKLSEVDKLKLQLAREKQQRLQAEYTNVQMLLRTAQAAISQSQVEHKALGTELRTRYSLAETDVLDEDGTIHRNAVGGQTAPAPVPPAAKA